MSGSGWRERRRRGVAAVSVRAAFAVACMSAGRVAAADTSRSVRIEYEAPPTCPDERSFVAQVRARTAKVTVVADGAPSVRVRITGRQGRFEGDVSLSDASGRDNGYSQRGQSQGSRLEGFPTPAPWSKLSWGLFLPVVFGGNVVDGHSRVDHSWIGHAVEMRKRRAPRSMHEIHGPAAKATREGENRQCQ